MPSTAIDRLNGLTTSVAVKAPCRAAATTSITRSGEQTVGGVACVSGDRVLDTYAGVNAGIYIVSTSAWTRAEDFDGNRDITSGTLIPVYNGANTFALYAVSNTGTITIGTTALTFELIGADSVALQGSLADSSAVGNGDALVAVKRTETSASATTQHVINQAREQYASADWGAPINGTTAASTAIGLAVTNGGKQRINFELGSYATRTLAFSTARQHWRGLGWTSDSDIAQRPGASLLKDANGTHLTISGDDVSLSNVHLDGVTASFTGDGLHVTGTRANVENVSVVKQRGVGIRIGGAATNGNLWTAIRPIAADNTGDGCYIHHTGGSVTGDFPAGIPDANAGVMIGGDFRSNDGAGMTLENQIDCVFLGPAFQDNTGKGMVLKDGARGNLVLHPYTEANNGGAAAAGDEIDVQAGAVQNFVLAARFQASGGTYAGWKDANPPGKNIFVHYEPGFGYWAWRSRFALWNPQQDGSSTTVEFNAFLGTAQVNAYNLIGAVSGTSGSTLTIQTKIDGGAVTSAFQIDALQRTKTLKGSLRTRATITYSASMDIDAAACDIAIITATNNTNYTINNPTNTAAGHQLSINIRNTSGGALGTQTLGAMFKTGAAWTQPANGTNRWIHFEHNGTSYEECGRSAADVTN